MELFLRDLHDNLIAKLYVDCLRAVKIKFYSHIYHPILLRYLLCYIDYII